MKVQFFADVDTIGNKRGTNELILKLVTQEIPDDEAGAVMKLRNKYVNVAMSTSELKEAEVKEMPDEFALADKIADGKSPSQRLRNVLYREWESRYKVRYPDFDTFYERRMEEIIEAEKDRI